MRTFIKYVNRQKGNKLETLIMVLINKQGQRTLSNCIGYRKPTHEVMENLSFEFQLSFMQTSGIMRIFNTKQI